MYVLTEDGFSYELLGTVDIRLIFIEIHELKDCLSVLKSLANMRFAAYYI